MQEGAYKGPLWSPLGSIIQHGDRDEGPGPKVACQTEEPSLEAKTEGEGEMCPRSYTLTGEACSKTNKLVRLEGREVLEEYVISLYLY